MKALAGDDDHPGGRRASTPTSRPSSTPPTATSPATPTTTGAPRPSRSSSTAAAATASAARSTDRTRSRPAASSSRTTRRQSQAEFEKNLDFALDLVKSAARPDEPKSHLGNTAPDLVPTHVLDLVRATRRRSRSTRSASLGNVRVYWQVNGGACTRGDLSEFAGGERYGKPGVYYHKLRGAGHRHSRPATRCEVWFAGAATRTSDPFTYTVKSDDGQPGAADARRGLHGHELRRRRRRPTRGRSTRTTTRRRSTTPASATTSTTSTPTAAPRPPRSACCRTTRP